MTITVIGSGRWGSCLAWYQATHLKQQTILMGQENAADYQMLVKERRNDYLTLPDNLKLTSSLAEALSSPRIIISVGAQALRGLAKTLNTHDVSGKTFILCMKGIEKGSGARLSQIMREEIKQKFSLAVWVGPGHPQEFVKGVPSCMVIDSDDAALREQLVKEFSSSLIRFYIGTDLVGTEIGAALKNVIGIAAGILDGLEYTGLKGALMTRAPHEVGRFITASGGDAMSAYGLAHLGDYEATLFSPHSHNRRFGEDFVNGKTFGKLAEGVDTLIAVLETARKKNISMPICEALEQVLFKGKPLLETLSKLFERDTKTEF